MWLSCFFFFNDTATTEIYTLSLHDALPICFGQSIALDHRKPQPHPEVFHIRWQRCAAGKEDRKSTRLNSSHGYISYAVFCLKKKTTANTYRATQQDRCVLLLAAHQYHWPEH